MEIEKDSFLNGNLLEFFMQIKVNVCISFEVGAHVFLYLNITVQLITQINFVR